IILSSKTTTGLSILRLLPVALRITSGKILFHGEDLFALPGHRMRQIRGKDISMIFQEPLNALNPLLTIGQQINEVLICHMPLTAKQRRERVLELLNIVGMAEPQRVAQNYPHQLSGGMRQRAMIAQAIAANPQLMIADEPTSSLDVTLQAKIMDLFRELRRSLNLSILLITHDLGMVRHLADEVVVLQAGKIVEQGPVAHVLESPRHQYTQQLISSVF
ncbi:MAG: ABC transporter ATP-binding protein, partial [Candidatus Omnitrophota bacterium]|nr:ABC transporter ATP-binding protein [Candidatus Omnitrophota bacterium]